MTRHLGCEKHVEITNKKGNTKVTKGRVGSRCNPALYSTLWVPPPVGPSQKSGVSCGAGIIVSALHIKKASGLNTGIFLGSVVWALAAFAGNHGRLWNANEKWRLTFGFLTISLAYDLFVCLAGVASGWNPGKALAFVVGGGFLGFLRLLALMLFMGPMARRLYGKSITTKT
jgi:hypothetical protein